MLNIVTALNSEAQPIIEHFSLARLQTGHPMRVFTNDDIRLIVSGIGNVRSAASVGYLAGLDGLLPGSPNDDSSRQHNAWINVGIAGHSHAEIGACFTADKIIDGRSGDTAYPSIPYATEIPSACLCTVERPEVNYPDSSLYDMEGYGFFLAAQRFSSVELISLLKVVSDNRDNHVNQINKGFVRSLIENAIREVEFTLKALRSLNAEPALSAEHVVIPWENMWRTTHSQKQILHDMHHRLFLLNKGIDVALLVSNCQTAHEAIAALNKKLTNTQLRLSPTP